MEPLFNVEENDTLVLVALAKNCKKATPLINLITHEVKIESASIFMTIIKFIPWINQILQERCISNKTTDIHANIF